MLIVEYNEFVRSTDQSISKTDDERRDIALYGLASEIGSLLSAVKKKILAEGGIENWNCANEEIIEELGDVIWYGFSLAQVVGKAKSARIFTQNIAHIRKELTCGNERAKKIHAILDPSKKSQFLAATKKFLNSQKLYFKDYQSLAFLTARTSGKELLKVCLAELWHLSSELLWEELPKIEHSLKKYYNHRSTETVLGDIAWHVAAIASIYELSLSEVVAANMQKVSFRMDRKLPTPLHDDTFDEAEQLPRIFDIAFITVGRGRSRMYLNGIQLGDELTDNSYEDDGYRFHDVMHLANVAHLGWSPVLRSLLKRKRKSNPRVDEVEDGARARIVEEAIVKAIHSEGVQLARQNNPEILPKPVALFPNKDHITFKFLKFVRNFLTGLEVESNKYWEWEDAILDGYRIFYELCKEEQGTVTIDMQKRSLNFSPDVFIDIKGTVNGIGSAIIDRDGSDFNIGNVLRADELEQYEPIKPTPSLDAMRVVAAKQAILGALNVHTPTPEQYKELKIKFLNETQVSIKCFGSVREDMWSRKIINFKTSLTLSQNIVGCTALAISDAGDSLK